MTFWLVHIHADQTKAKSVISSRTSISIFIFEKEKKKSRNHVQSVQYPKSQPRTLFNETMILLEKMFLRRLAAEYRSRDRAKNISMPHSVAKYTYSHGAACAYMFMLNRQNIESGNFAGMSSHAQRRVKWSLSWRLIRGFWSLREIFWNSITQLREFFK